jgi:hypothetical protein
LWPVVVGGLLTMGGGVIAGVVTVISKLIDWDVERKRRRVEKFEQLVLAIYEHDHWVDQARQSRVYSNGTPDPGLSPLAKIEAIAAAYFPAVMGNVAKFKTATINYDAWMAQAMMKAAQNKRDELNDGLNEVIRLYVDAQGDLINQLIKIEATKLQPGETSTKLTDWWRQGPGRAVDSK